MRISDVPADSLECIMNYIDDPRDRAAMSLVCKLWYEIDARTRKHITIDFCYTTTPAHLRQRFPHLESLKLKGKPRASMFNLMPEDWGGYAGPWINEISVDFNEISMDFKWLTSLHFRRMIVQDKDLEILAGSRGQTLEALKLDKCSGFSTDGLLHITRSCRCLRHLFLEESTIDDKDGAWIHELALNNTVLETLNFYLTYLKNISIQDLELIARNCRSLVSIKISDDPEILKLTDFFQYTTALEEFAGGSFGEQPDNYNALILPQTLRCLGPSYIEKDMMPIVYPLTSLLKKLDLLYTFLDTEGHCQLIRRCLNLEILEARNVIGDRGLEVLAKSCKRLKRLRIERGEDEEGMEDEQGVVSQRGLSALAQGCVELEYIAIHVSDINNASLESIGTHCKNLCDFRLVLLDQEEQITELPLDNGVRALLMGCKRLKRFAFYVRPGALTDVGLSYIGQYSNEVRWMLLGYVGESDAGILGFSKGCPNLQKLEMRGCCFSEHTLALAVSQLTSLRYLWVQQLKAPLRSSDLSPMVRRYWNIEFFPYTELARPDQILAYYSLAGQRRDCPSVVVPLDP